MVHNMFYFLIILILKLNLIEFLNFNFQSIIILKYFGLNFKILMSLIIIYLKLNLIPL